MEAGRCVEFLHLNEGSLLGSSAVTVLLVVSFDQHLFTFPALPQVFISEVMKILFYGQGKLREF